MNPRVTNIWQSEATMEAAYTELLHLTKFDRTKDAGKLITKLLTELVNPHPTFFDIREWVVANIDDFNLASQILLNAQKGSVHFKLPELERAVNQYQKDGVLVWSGQGESPFEKKAKFKEGDDEQTKQYNTVLANQRNFKLLSEAKVAINSFRITPISSTPALSDMNNLSNISIIGLKQFVGDDVAIWMLNHKAIEQEIELRQQDDGGYQARGLTFPIYSKSGGDIASRSITSRWLAYKILSTSLGTYVVPKYDSLLLVGEPLPAELQEYAVEFKG